MNQSYSVNSSLIPRPLCRGSGMRTGKTEQPTEIPCMLLDSLAGQTLATPTGGRVWSNSHHDLVSNTPRIVLIGLVTNGGARLPFLACCFKRQRPALPERVSIYVHTYFIRRLAAECAIQKPDGNLTRLSPFE